MTPVMSKKRTRSAIERAAEKLRASGPVFVQGTPSSWPIDPDNILGKTPVKITGLPDGVIFDSARKMLVYDGGLSRAGESRVVLRASKALEKRLRGAPDGVYLVGSAGDIKQRHLHEAADAIRDLRAERDALAKDAERYRWLRQRLEVRSQQSLAGVFKSGLDVRVGCSFFDSNTVAINKPRDYTILDAAIDAALAAQERKP